MLRKRRWFAGLSSVVALVVATSSCSSDSTSPDNDLRAFITSVASISGGVAATFHEGAPPSGGSGPTIDVSGTSAFITGGGAIRTITSSSSFSRVVVAVAGIDGYWDLTLPSASASQAVILTIAQELPQSTFQVEYAAGSSGSIGSFDTESVNITEVGTGDIQVSVSWDAESDVDLHVVEPGTSGQEIYYGHESSTSGGTLDLDSNPSCSIDHIKNENITYPTTSSPPHGTYTVRVDYYSGCGVPSTRYVVTIRVKGQSLKTFTGSFTGTGDHGAAGAGTLVGTFTY